MEVERQQVRFRNLFLSFLSFARVEALLSSSIQSLRTDCTFDIAAWSLTYLFLHAKNAIVSRRPGPLALVTGVAAQAGCYGYYYATV